MPQIPLVRTYCKDSPTPDGSVADFWFGLWHGLILPVTLLVSLFQDGVNVCEAYNNGGWYNFGFLGVRLLCWAGEGVQPVKQRESSQPVDQRTK